MTRCVLYCIDYSQVEEERGAAAMGSEGDNKISGEKQRTLSNQVVGAWLCCGNFAQIIQGLHSIAIVVHRQFCKRSGDDEGLLPRYNFSQCFGVQSPESAYEKNDDYG